MFCSLATTAGFKWLPYDGSEPYTYNRAVSFCEKNALQLCSREQYCEGGKGGTLLAGAGDMAVGDKWAPVRDSDNTWIQTGDGGGHGHKRCWTHDEQGYGKARWGITGLTSDEGGDGRDVCCASTTTTTTTTTTSTCLREPFNVGACIYACVLLFHAYIYATRGVPVPPLVAV